MSGWKILNLVAAAALVAAVQSAWADNGDEVLVRDFVAQCQTPNDACKTEVLGELTAGDMSGDTCEPDLSDEAYTAAIVGWLRGHPEWNDRQMDDGIYSAAAALWPCR